MFIMSSRPLIRVGLLAAALAVSLAVSACSSPADPPPPSPAAPCPAGGQAPDLLTPPVLGPSVDLTQELSKPDDAYWTTSLLDALAGTRVLATVYWMRVVSEDPFLTEEGPLLLRGVDLTDGSIIWTDDLSDHLPQTASAGPANPADWMVTAESDTRDAFAVTISQARLPLPEDPAIPAVLLTIEAPTGTVRGLLDDPGHPGGLNASFLTYRDGLVAIDDGQTTYGARDTDLATPVWSHPAAADGDPVIKGLVLTGDGYVDLATGTPTGLGADLSEGDANVSYLGVADQVFRLSSQAPSDDAPAQSSATGLVMLVDADGAPLWSEPWGATGQQIVVGDGLAVTGCDEEVCAIGLDDGEVRWTHQTSGPTTIQGANDKWVFLTEQTVDAESLPESSGLALRAGDGSQALKISLSGSASAPYYFGGCTAYTVERGLGDEDQLVARDMGADDLRYLWSVPEFDGVLHVFDGVMVVHEVTENRLAQVVAS